MEQINENYENHIYESISESARNSSQRCTRRSLKLKFDKEVPAETSIPGQRSGVTWCEGFSLNMPSVNPRQALKNGADKLTQTLNTVRTTFGTLSQKLRKSTRRRQPLTNVDSPQTPVTPYTRSRHVLGRTPTKMYSPFGFETPTGKENGSRRCLGKIQSPGGGGIKKKFRNQRTVNKSFSPKTNFLSDAEQTQIGIYEFQSTANQIIRRSMRQ